MVEVAVIGAGPYGLSIAAHLRHLRVPFRVFGKPMGMWRDHMPRGLMLNSDASASSIAAPGDGFPLERFCREGGRADGLPTGPRVRGDVMAEYGQEFQRRYVGEVDEARVLDVARLRRGFRLTLESGEQVLARKIVVATGLLSLRHVPESLASLAPGVVSHSSAHSDLSGFGGRQVVVMGAGQSACELAALLNEQGAEVTMLTRRPLKWHEPEDDPGVLRNAWQRAWRPNSGLGPGWRNWFWSEMPHQFSHLPQSTRHAKAYGLFAPAGSGWIRHRVDGVIPIRTGALRGVRMHGDGARLLLETAEGSVELSADHVIAATGYRPEVGRLPFLEGIAGDIRTVRGAPLLDRGFESSVPGLHFAGFLGASTFGPSMRFIYGARFAAQRLSQHLSRLGDGRRRTARVAVTQSEQARVTV